MSGSLKSWLAVAAASAAVLLGCGAPEEGEIVAKDYDDAWTQILMQYNAATKTSYPMTIFHDEDFSFRLRYCPAQKDCEDGWRSVDETTYNSMEVGDYYEGSD
jgi:hypothetical protein